jgi:outer membrane lipoprotein carrier protein
VLAVSLLAIGAVAVEETGKDAVVNGVESRYNRVASLEADFVQRYTLGPTTIVESGRVYFQKPGKMRWDYNSPEEKLFLSDGEYAYFYIPAERQARRTKLKKATYWQATFALMLGRANLKKVFDRIDVVPVNRPEQAGEAVRWQVRGTARSEKQAFYEIWFDLNAQYQILRVEIQQRDGSLMEFHFRRWREGHTLSADLFRLDVPSGTAWIDEGER